jgi:hypothetical protein
MSEINFVVLDNISSWEDEVFTFQPKNKKGEKIGDPLFFNATKLRALCDKTPNKYRIKARINQEHYDSIIRSGAVERNRLNWLAENPSKLCEPIILCHYPEDDTQILVDGNHRLALLFNMGLRELPAYYVHKDVWQDFLIPFPKELAEVFLK